MLSFDFATISNASFVLIDKGDSFFLRIKNGIDPSLFVKANEETIFHSPIPLIELDIDVNDQKNFYKLKVIEFVESIRSKRRIKGIIFLIKEGSGSDYELKKIVVSSEALGFETLDQFRQSCFHYEEQK